MDRRVSRKVGPFGDGFMKQKGSNPGSIVGIARASEIGVLFWQDIRGLEFKILHC
jgi:hypothetical protein